MFCPICWSNCVWPCSLPPLDDDWWVCLSLCLRCVHWPLLPVDLTTLCGPSARQIVSDHGGGQQVESASCFLHDDGVTSDLWPLTPSSRCAWHPSGSSSSPWWASGSGWRRCPPRNRRRSDWFQSCRCSTTSCPRESGCPPPPLTTTWCECRTPRQWCSTPRTRYISHTHTHTSVI